MINDRTYTKGLHEIGDGAFGYLQPDGGWGWSNAGLLVGDGESLLVDTLFDLNLTRDMLDTMAAHTAAAPIRTLVNTHANGDHTFGNELVEGAEIIASAGTASEFADLPPSMLVAMTAGGLGEPLDGYMRRSFGAFDFEGIELAPPTRTFERRLDLDAAGRRVSLIEVGPAHTKGDTLVHVPDEGLMFTGDILFIYGTPIVWDGPISNWVAACDLIIDLGPPTIVPGHGPVTDRTGVEMVKGYLDFVVGEATQRHAAGMAMFDAAADIELGGYAEWNDAERIVFNVAAVYRDLDPGFEQPGVVEMFEAMARL